MAANPCFLLVREGGVEPPRRYRHRILNPARLPIPPLSDCHAPVFIRVHQTHQSQTSQRADKFRVGAAVRYSKPLVE